MYDVGGKLLNGIKNMYVNNLVCIILKGGESECFRIDGGVRQSCIISGGGKRVRITWPLICR